MAGDNLPDPVPSHLDDLRSADSKPTAALYGSDIVLPIETIYNIFRFLGSQDLIRLQTVSKLFHAIVQDPALWRTIYATARFTLPPGPFPWQSIQFLQRTLVYSTRLARSWTTEPLTLISTKIHMGPRTLDDDRLRWVCGRWVIVSKGMRQLRSRDVDTGSEQVLWDNGAFSHWAATSLMVPQAHFIYVVVHLGRGRLNDPVKLLEFIVDDDTGHLSDPEVLDVPTWYLPMEAYIPRVRIESGNAPYACISLCSIIKPRYALLFDPRNRRFYKFPRFRTRLDLLLNYRGAWLPHLVEVYFTPTHVFVLNRSYLIHGNIGQVEVVQTFSLPDVYDPDLDNSESNPGLLDEAEIRISDDQQAVLQGHYIGPDPDPYGLLFPDGQPRPKIPVRELRLTHEMLTRDTGSLWLFPIHHATDALTQTTTLRFLHTYATPSRQTPEKMFVRLGCTDYVLPAPPIDVIGVDEDKDENEVEGEKNDKKKKKTEKKKEDYNDPNLNTIVRSAGPILPIHVSSHNLFSVPGMWRGNWVDVSHDGFVRGICGVGWRDEPGPLGYSTSSTEMVYKFTVETRGAVADADTNIDTTTTTTTGERCIAVVGEASPPWAGLDPIRHYDYTMDGMMGRMWYITGDVRQNDAKGKPVDQDILAIVVDFK